MRSIIFATTILLVGICQLSFVTKEDPSFELHFMQDGKEVPVNHGVVKLQKKPFAIEIEMSKKLGLMVSASFKSKMYKKAMKDEHIHELEIFNGKGLVEEKFNRDKNILISDEHPNYWFYSTDKANRFDKVVKDEYSPKVSCTRTVTMFKVADTKEEIDVTEIAKEVYLIFMLTKVGDNSLDKIEIQRAPVMIEWVQGSSPLDEEKKDETDLDAQW